MAKSIFFYNSFLNPLSTSDINISIIDSRNQVKYVINPNSVNGVFAVNNLLRIDLRDRKDIFLEFLSSSDAKLALPILQNRINDLKSKRPYVQSTSISHYNVGNSSSIYRPDIFLKDRKDIFLGLSSSSSFSKPYLRDFDDVKSTIPYYIKSSHYNTGTSSVYPETIETFSANYSSDTFLKEITSGDINIQIYDIEGMLQYTINVFAIINTFISNNLLNISVRGLKDVVLDFSTPTDAQLALSILQSRIEILRQKVPLFIDKQISNYVANQMIIRGWQGFQGIQGFQGWQGFQGIQGQGVQGYQGFQSDQGLQGWQGSQGLQGQGYQGWQGFQSDQGLQGWQGY